MSKWVYIIVVSKFDELSDATTNNDDLIRICLVVLFNKYCMCVFEWSYNIYYSGNTYTCLQLALDQATVLD